jgi:mannitol/fructose-specific phosphotransferase system IIA component (Ntr-type)
MHFKITRLTKQVRFVTIDCQKEKVFIIIVIAAIRPKHFKKVHLKLANSYSNCLVLEVMQTFKLTNNILLFII